MLLVVSPSTRQLATCRRELVQRQPGVGLVWEQVIVPEPLELRRRNGAPVTVQSIELGKLRLSERLAQRVSLQTGVCFSWLLQNDYTAPPIWNRDARQPYTKRAYEMTRAEICNPRTDPCDLLLAEGVVAHATQQLAAGLLTAYRRNQTVFFYYKLREFLEDFTVEFPPARDLDRTQLLGKLMRHLHECLVEAAKSK